MAVPNVNLASQYLSLIIIRHYIADDRFGKGKDHSQVHLDPNDLFRQMFEGMQAPHLIV